MKTKILAKIFIFIIIFSNFYYCSKSVVKKPKQKYYVFYYRTTKIIKSIYVAGNFNSWQTNNFAFRMKQKNGEYYLKVNQKSLKKGKNLYVFVIDGEWILDPKAKKTENRGIGGKVGVFYIN